MAGDQYTLTCPISGQPSPHITWYRYSDIDSSHALPLPPHASNTTSWSVSEWQEDYNGYYVCCGANVHGNTCYTDLAHHRLFASPCDSAASPLAHTYRTPNKEAYVAGATVATTCIVSNMERSLWQPVWYHRLDDRSVRLDTNTTGHYTTGHYSPTTCSWHSTLTLLDIGSNEAGTYTCAYYDTIANTTITIAGAPYRTVLVHVLSFVL